MITDNTTRLLNKWAPVLGKDIKGPARIHTAIMLENALTSQEHSSGFREKEKIAKLLTEAPITGVAGGMTANLPINLSHAPNTLSSTPNLGDGSSLAGYDTLLINMIKRLTPSLIAYDMVGIQPLLGPSGLVLASRWVDSAGKDWFNPAEPNAITSDGSSGFATSSNPVEAGVGETEGQSSWAEIILKVSRVTATAKSRLFRADVTEEVLQDIASLYGTDGMADTANAMMAVAAHTINKEIVDLIKVAAVPENAASPIVVGGFDDASYHTFFYNLQMSAMKIARDTGKARGNFVLVSPRVAAYIWAWMTRGELFDRNYWATDTFGNSANNSYLGIISGDMRVYVDHSATTDFAVVGAKGATPFDAGFIFAPYQIGEQILTGRDPTTMQPQIGLRSRYAIIANPHAAGFNNVDNLIQASGTNRYYRRISITGLPLGNTVI